MNVRNEKYLFSGRDDIGKNIIIYWGDSTVSELPFSVFLPLIVVFNLGFLLLARSTG
ncbi:hypothetical protein [Alkalihalobacillus sp. LMS39]|uniref:hypothetical protein n=1 Tax=Alkalihalobacillus sp. LMS39 TaxID=2924032 RepID=UPI001FB4E1DD|nr:hypothetical protein [Alkalihalobacillus sp. LMS39]UOE94451.1 hypothetical protein MM271_01900 [Alkalihalobacillus sp. LMS39]